MAFNRNHRHNPTAPVGLILGKLALGIGAAILKKVLVDKLTSKKQVPAEKIERDESRRNGPHHGSGSVLAA